MTKEDIIKDFENNIYCRLKPSLVEGVGVFAIREIPKGTDPFISYSTTDYAIPIPEKEIMENPKITEAVKEMIRAFYVTENGNIYCSQESLNDIDISFFVNHSDRPNLEAKEVDGETHFTAIRNIHAGEELTANYSTYTDS